MGDEARADFSRYRRQTLGLEHVGTRVEALFKSTEPARAEQKANLDRVSTRIAGAILAFFASRIGQQFHADQLRQHVAAQCGPLAPASADRVMRDLRRKGAIAYRVINRAQSLYLGQDPKTPKEAKL